MTVAVDIDIAKPLGWSTALFSALVTIIGARNIYLKPDNALLIGVATIAILHTWAALIHLVSRFVARALSARG